MTLYYGPRPVRSSRWRFNHAPLRVKLGVSLPLILGLSFLAILVLTGFHAAHAQPCEDDGSCVTDYFTVNPYFGSEYGTSQFQVYDDCLGGVAGTFTGDGGSYPIQLSTDCGNTEWTLSYEFCGGCTFTDGNTQESGGDSGGQFYSYSYYNAWSVDFQANPSSMTYTDNYQTFDVTDGCTDQQVGTFNGDGGEYSLLLSNACGGFSFTVSFDSSTCPNSDCYFTDDNTQETGFGSTQSELFSWNYYNAVSWSLTLTGSPSSTIGISGCEVIPSSEMGDGSTNTIQAEYPCANDSGVTLNCESCTFMGGGTTETMNPTPPYDPPTYSYEVNPPGSAFNLAVADNGTGGKMYFTVNGGTTCSGVSPGSVYGNGGSNSIDFDTSPTCTQVTLEFQSCTYCVFSGYDGFTNSSDIGISGGDEAYINDPVVNGNYTFYYTSSNGTVDQPFIFSKYSGTSEISEFAITGSCGQNATHIAGDDNEHNITGTSGCAITFTPPTAPSPGFWVLAGDYQPSITLYFCETTQCIEQGVGYQYDLNATLTAAAGTPNEWDTSLDLIVRSGSSSGGEICAVTGSEGQGSSDCMATIGNGTIVYFPGSFSGLLTNTWSASSHEENVSSTNSYTVTYDETINEVEGTITMNYENGASSSVFSWTLANCGVSPTSFTGTSHSYTADSGCSVGVSSTGNSNEKYVFSTALTSSSFTTGTTSSFYSPSTFNIWLGLKNTYTFDPVTADYPVLNQGEVFDAIGNIGGETGQTLCSVTVTTTGGSASVNCSGFSNYDVQLALMNGTADVDYIIWYATDTYQFTPTSYGNTYTTTYRLYSTGTEGEIAAYSSGDGSTSNGCWTKAVGDTPSQMWELFYNQNGLSISSEAAGGSQWSTPQLLPKVYYSTGGEGGSYYLEEPSTIVCNGDTLYVTGGMNETSDIEVVGILNGTVTGLNTVTWGHGLSSGYYGEAFDKFGTISAANDSQGVWVAVADMGNFTDILNCPYGTLACSTYYDGGTYFNVGSDELGEYCYSPNAFIVSASDDRLIVVNPVYAGTADPTESCLHDGSPSYSDPGISLYYYYSGASWTTITYENDPISCSTGCLVKSVSVIGDKAEIMGTEIDSPTNTTTVWYYALPYNTFLSNLITPQTWVVDTPTEFGHFSWASSVQVTTDNSTDILWYLSDYSVGGGTIWKTFSTDGGTEWSSVIEVVNIATAFDVTSVSASNIRNTYSYVFFSTSTGGFYALYGDPSNPGNTIIFLGSDFLNNDGSKMQMAVTAVTFIAPNNTQYTEPIGVDFTLASGNTTIVDVEWAGITVPVPPLVFNAANGAPSEVITDVYNSNNVEFGSAGNTLSSIGWNAPLAQLSFTGSCATQCAVYSPGLGGPYYVLINSIIYSQTSVTPTMGWTWDGTLAHVYGTSANYVISWTPATSPGGNTGSNGSPTTTETETSTSTSSISTSTTQQQQQQLNVTQILQKIYDAIPVPTTIPAFLIDYLLWFIVIVTLTVSAFENYQRWGLLSAMPLIALDSWTIIDFAVYISQIIFSLPKWSLFFFWNFDDMGTYLLLINYLSPTDIVISIFAGATIVGLVTAGATGKLEELG